jgi:hypothetical protein
MIQNVNIIVKYIVRKCTNNELVQVIKILVPLSMWLADC